MITIVFALRFTRAISSFKGFLSLGFIHLRIAIERVRSEKFVKEVLASKKDFVMDETKHRSLHSANQPKVKSNSPEIAMAHKPLVMPKKTPPMETGFTHEFFGSELTVGDIKLCQGLTREKHTLEIEHDQLRIDNIPKRINQGELEKIKALIIQIQRGE